MNKEKIYVTTDSVLGIVTIEELNEEWFVSAYNWEKVMLLLLTPIQYKYSFEEDFYGYVNIKRYVKARNGIHFLDI